MAPPSPTFSVTRAIYLSTLAALAVVATLSVVIYRSAVRDTVAQHSTQQLAMVRTAAVGVKGEDPTVATVLIPRVMTADEEAAELALTAAPSAAEVPTTAQKAKEEEAAGGGGGARDKPTVKDDKKNMKEAKDKK